MFLVFKFAFWVVFSTLFVASQPYLPSSQQSKNLFNYLYYITNNYKEEFWPLPFVLIPRSNPQLFPLSSKFRPNSQLPLHFCVLHLSLAASRAELELCDTTCLPQRPKK